MNKRKSKHPFDQTITKSHLGLSIGYCNPLNHWKWDVKSGMPLQTNEWWAIWSSVNHIDIQPNVLNDSN